MSSSDEMERMRQYAVRMADVPYQPPSRVRRVGRVVVAVLLWLIAGALFWFDWWVGRDGDLAAQFAVTPLLLAAGLAALAVSHGD